MINVCAFHGVGLVVVPIRVLKVQVGIGFISAGNHVGEMRLGALVGMFRVLVFDKGAFAVEMFIFGTV